MTVSPSTILSVSENIRRSHVPPEVETPTDRARPSQRGKNEMIKGLHHNAYRCRDSEETRHFYEDFLGLPLIEALPIGETKTGRKANVLHSFFQMVDGSCLAFFEVPDEPFDFKEQHDFDLHIALEVDAATLESMLEKGKAAGIKTRGIADHGFCRSIYFRDPNGYVIELAAPIGAGAGRGTGRGEARRPRDSGRLAGFEGYRAGGLSVLAGERGASARGTEPPEFTARAER